MRKVDVVPYDPMWQDKFDAEAEQIVRAMDKSIVAIHHIGSTAIPGIYAKPILDLLVEAKDLDRVDQQTPAMELLGYEGMGEFGIPGRRYFRKDNREGIRTHHVHVFETTSEQIKRHLAFRDYMIAHPEDAQKYSKLKRELARKYPADINAYMDGKDSFICEMDRKAARWKAPTLDC